MDTLIIKGNISRNFTWEEMMSSETACKHGLSNVPGEEEQQAIEDLVKRVLQPLLQAYGDPIRISSGYRCMELNRLTGGSPHSQHIRGEAADCVAGNAQRLLGVLLGNDIPFDQAILYKKQNFLHVSIKSDSRLKNRREIIINNGQ
ncbi:peptidase M15 [Bacteroidia bacterium]|nr:peptidase M15 [Bacteroidia bacterium]